jgi:hypothetical protein
MGKGKADQAHQIRGWEALQDGLLHGRGRVVGSLLVAVEPCKDQRRS